MNINTITTDDLRRMEGKDGLVLQGCGGDLKEWVDGINDMFTEAGILKDGSKFELSRKGLATLSPTVIAMAEAEGLGAHAAAVRVRMKGGVL